MHGRAGINDETRRRVLAIAKKIGYRPNLAARSLSMGNRVRVAVCVPREIHYFYNELWEGIRDEARRYEDRGLEFRFYEIPRLGRGELPLFRNALKAGVQGIVVTPGNPGMMTPVINDAEREDVRVVCVSTDAPESRRSAVVCVEPRLNGLIAGELMSNFVSPGAKVAILTGMLETVDHSEKAEGFTSSFKKLCPGGNVVATIEGHEDERESFQKVQRLLKQIPELSGIYVNTVNCLPVCRALCGMKLAGKVRLIATDLFQDMIPFFEQGVIHASMHQRPYRQGQLAVRSLAEHLVHGAELAEWQLLNPGIILRSNLQLFREAGGRSA